MPTQPQLIFDRTAKTKQEIKEIKIMMRDALSNSAAYQKVLEEMENIKLKKKNIVSDILDEFASEADKLEILKSELQNDNMLLSDATLSDYLKGKIIEVEDKFGNKYEPVFTVKFKKI